MRMITTILDKEVKLHRNENKWEIRIKFDAIPSNGMIEDVIKNLSEYLKKSFPQFFDKPLYGSDFYFDNNILHFTLSEEKSE